MDTDTLVRERAYLIWEKENRPHGRDKEHWDAAMKEILALQAPAPAKRVRKSVAAATVPVAKKAAAPKAKTPKAK